MLLQRRVPAWVIYNRRLEDPYLLYKVYRTRIKTSKHYIYNILRNYIRILYGLSELELFIFPRIMLSEKEQTTNQKQLHKKWTWNSNESKNLGYVSTQVELLLTNK